MGILKEGTELSVMLSQSAEVDYEIIEKIRDSEIQKYLLSLLIKFTEFKFEINNKEMEEYVNILFQQKIELRINEIKSLLGKNNSNNNELLSELSELIKKLKRGVYVSNRN